LASPERRVQAKLRQLQNLQAYLVRQACPAVSPARLVQPKRLPQAKRLLPVKRQAKCHLRLVRRQPPPVLAVEYSLDSLF
jgi:hypothetical protein